MARAAALIVHEARVLLIERRREAGIYYLFPGGGIELGETPEQALVRELWEEVGLTVAAGRLIATITYNGNEQHYYAATRTGDAAAPFVGDEARSSNLGTSRRYPRAVSPPSRRRSPGDILGSRLASRSLDCGGLRPRPSSLTSKQAATASM